MNIRALASSPPSSMVVEVLIAWVAATLIGLAILFLAAPILMQTDSSQLPKLQSWIHRVGAVLIVPLLETLFMLPVLEVLRRLIAPITPARYQTAALVLSSALAWSLMHGSVAVGWAITTFWPFVVFSYMFLRWESAGLNRAIIVATAVHALHNATAVALSVALGK